MAVVMCLEVSRPRVCVCGLRMLSKKNHMFGFLSLCFFAFNLWLLLNGTVAEVKT